MLYVFHGPDRFRAREELRQIRRDLDKDGNLANNTVELDRDQARRISVADFSAACQSHSFFAEDRLVVIEGLQARFSGQRRRSASGRASARRTEAAQSDLEKFAAVLADLPGTTTVVLLDESPAAAFMDSLPVGTKVRAFPILRTDNPRDDYDVRRWLGDHVRNLGISISPQASDRLLQMLDGNHLGELAQELDKLAMYALGRRIEVADVEALASSAVEFQSWDLTDAIIAGRADRALSVLQRMDRSRYPAQMLFSIITRQYRQILVGQALLRDGMGQSQIASALGLAPYPAQKVVEQAGRYPADRLETAYRRLLAADVSIKTGVTDVETALDLVIVELAGLAQQPRARAGSR